MPEFKKNVEISVDEDVWIDIEPGDYVDECSDAEIKELKELLKIDDKDIFNIQTLADQEKYKILIEAYNKYSLTELQDLLKI